MKRYCIILYMLYICIHSYADIFGALTPIPYKPYLYHNQEAVGITTKANFPIVWTVTNGKIMDDDGNFTLTSKTVYVGNDDIYVQWNGLMDMKSVGTLEYSWNYDQVYHIIDVAIEPANLLIQNERITDSQNFEYPYITFENSDITNGSSIQINGYRSVNLLPGFTIKQGANVRIYNENPPLPSTYVPYSMMRAATENDGHINKCRAILEQNIPNPVINETYIYFFVPDGTKSAFIQIYDNEGKFIKKFPITQIGYNQLLIKHTDFISGIYLYSLIIDEKLIDTKRMIVE